MARSRSPRLARWVKNELSPRGNPKPGTWSDVGGALLCQLGLAALYFLHTRNDFSFETHWPVLGFAAFVLIPGWMCLRAAWELAKRFPAISRRSSERGSNGPPL